MALARVQKESNNVNITKIIPTICFVFQQNYVYSCNWIQTHLERSKLVPQYSDIFWIIQSTITLTWTRYFSRILSNYCFLVILWKHTEWQNFRLLYYILLWHFLLKVWASVYSQFKLFKASGCNITVSALTNSFLQNTSSEDMKLIP